MFYSESSLKTIAWETASQIPMRKCLKMVREEPGNIGVFAGGEKKSMLSNIKTLLITKIKHLKLMISVFFYIWEDARE